MVKSQSTKTYSFDPDYAIPPGETLREKIDEIGMTQRELATRTGLSTKTINLIVSGKEPITQNTAAALEMATGVPLRLWLMLEAQYREQLAKIESSQKLSESVDWLKNIPVSKLAAYGFVQKTKDKAALLDSVLRFFGVKDVDAWENLWQDDTRLAFRQSAAFQPDTGATATWCRIAELEAQKCQCNVYSKSKFQSALQEIRKLTSESPEVFEPNMKKLCQEAGVAVVLVPEIKGCRASGAAWWSSDKAVIVLNLRGKKDDKFWFTFFHEAGHILKGHKRESYIDIDNGNTSSSDCEKEADDFASNFLIPREFSDELETLKSLNDIRRFARKIGIAPGIVAGRIQHDRGCYARYNDLKRTFQWRDQSK